MKQCPVCKRELSDELDYCPFDGRSLTGLDPSDGLVGTLLDDKYRLDEKIGEGGMGTVYRGTHIQMEHTIAVKILHQHLASDHTALERFRREARAAAQIRHPNAVSVTDFGVTKDSGIAYLVMEFLEGNDLRIKINRDKQLDYYEALIIMNQVCAAVYAAHNKGIIHRDLKPDNIWLVQSDKALETVKVLDFGIAKLKTSSDKATSLTQHGMIVGTPYYMSPEQCRGEDLDPRSDVYSLGVILYQLLTGRVPFDGESPIAVVLKHNTERPRPLRAYRPDMPPEIEGVVLRALAKKKEDRQETAIQLAQEFEAALDASGIQPGPMAATLGEPFYAARALRTEAARRQATEEAAQPTKFIGAIQQAPPAAYDENEPTVFMGSVKSEIVVAEVPRDAAESSTEASPRLTGKAVAAARTDAGRVITTVPARRSAKPYVAGAVVVAAMLITALVLLRPKPPANPEPGPGAIPAGMVAVKGGTFKMGNADPKGDPKYGPAHDVSVADFMMDKYEVTNEDFSRFVKARPDAAPPDWKDGVYDPQKAKLPVANITWFDAKAYADWAGKRLPTEAEWEYAARGTEGRIYPWGNEWSPECSNSAEDQKKQPVAVGSYSRGVSWCQVYDMAGNVAEWVADDYQPYPGSTAKVEPGNRVYRGGAFNFHKQDLACTTRWWDAPDTKTNYIGFRCAKDAPK
jgi:formylglycine-generating enzyme required for sulfatase activity